MSTIHMDTGFVREFALKMDQSVSAIYDSINQLRSLVSALDWRGSSYDEFIGEFDQITNRLILKTEDGLTLSQRVIREVEEWERVD